MPSCSSVRLLLAVAALTVVAGNDSSCGATEPSKIKDCDKIDHGSCGGACCMVDYELNQNTTLIYDKIKRYLMSGGEDGSYNYSTGPDAAGHNPGDSLLPYPIKWDYIFQGTHTTTGGYVDTLNFNLARADATGATTLRIFSISNVHGSLGDNGQNYKNIAFLPVDGRGAIVHGCGK